MNISARTEYACIAMLELALRDVSTEPVRIRDLAAAHGIPSRFLVQILLQLKSAGLVASTRGAAGGYRLAKPPAEIVLGQIMDVVEGPSTAGGGNTHDTSAARVLRRTWQQAADAQRSQLDTTTLAELAEQVGNASAHMDYI